MREILFRGKRADNGEWVFGYLTKKPHAVQIGEQYGPYYIERPPRDPDDGGDCDNVILETVGQYTGLTDKNGTKIFEGDILQNKGNDIYSGKYNFLIFHDTPNAMFLGVNERNGIYLCGDMFEYCRVIGNIHDNPALL